MSNEPYASIREINPALIAVAQWRADGEQEKQGFVPAGADVAAATGGMPPGGAPPGMPPMDPAAMGGAPPGMPPMDPAAMGGAPPGMPPTDPAAMGGAPMPPMDPAAGGAVDPATQAAIDAAVQAALAAGGAGGAPGTPGAPGAAGPGKGAKIDPGMIYMELGRVRKLLTGMYQNLDWELPPDILDDQLVAQSVAGQQPESTPTDQPPAGNGAAPAQAPGLPSIGQSAGINPIAPAGDGAAKTAESVLDILTGKRVGAEISAETFSGANQHVDALAELSRSLNRRAST